MAVLQKIRNGAGILVMIFVGVALFLFIIDPKTFDWLRNMNRTTIALVDGDKIDYSDFIQYENFHSQYILKAQQKTSLTNEESEQVRQLAWNEILQNHLYLKEMEKTGLFVSDEELSDLLWGTNIHYVIQQNFTNPNTGQMDTANIKRFFEMADTDPNYSVIANYWKTVIKKDRFTTKYNTLIGKAFYTPVELAKQQYFDKMNQFSSVVLCKYYNSVPDSTVTVSDAEIAKYLKENDYKFQQDKEYRQIDYVVFPVFPSAEDTAAVRTEIEELYTEFNGLTTGHVEFALSNDDNPTPSIFIGEKDLPRGLPEDFFGQADGTTSDIILFRDTYVFSKIIESDIRPDSVQLAYIALVQNDTTTLEQCKHKADSLKLLVETGKMDFQVLAYFNTADESTKQKGGDLGWFLDGINRDGTKIREDLNDFAFKGKTGDLITLPLYNNNGQENIGLFRIINMTEKSKKVKLATITKRISFSPVTSNKIYGDASAFMSKCDGKAEKFDSIVAAENIIPRGSQLFELDNKIANIDNARDFIRNWVYAEDRKVGNISEVEGFIDKYIVVKIKEIVPKGVKPLDVVKETIRFEIIKKKKAEILLTQVEKEIVGKDLIDFKGQEGYRYDTVKNTNFLSYSFGGFGAEPKANGYLGALKENVVSKPIQGNNGVYVVKLISVTPAMTKEDYKSEQINSMQMLSSQTYKINTTLEKKSKIKDLRYKFF